MKAVSNLLSENPLRMTFADCYQLFAILETQGFRMATNYTRFEY
jgi:hypothetical protein